MPGNINNLPNEFSEFINRNTITFPDGFIPKFIQDTVDMLTTLKSAMEHNDLIKAFASYVILDNLENKLQSKKTQQFLLEEGQQKISARITECTLKAFAQITTPGIDAFKPAVADLADRQVNVWTAYFYDLIATDYIDIDIVFKSLADHITINLLREVKVNGENEIYSLFKAKLVENFLTLKPYIEVETNISALIDIIKSCYPNGCKIHKRSNPLESNNPVDILASIRFNAKQQIYDEFNAAIVAEGLSPTIQKHVLHHESIKNLIATTTAQSSYAVFAKNYIALNFVKATLKASNIRLAEFWLTALLNELNLIWAIEPVKLHKGGELLNKMADIILERQFEQLLHYYTLPVNMYQPTVTANKPKIARIG